MNIQITKWGNSLGLRIPSAIAKELGLHDGSQLDLQEIQGSLVLRPVQTNPEYSLEAMLAEITPETLHEETDWGISKGKEAW